jgi:hypothetical protein
MTGNGQTSSKTQLRKRQRSLMLSLAKTELVDGSSKRFVITCTGIISLLEILISLMEILQLQRSKLARDTSQASNPSSTPCAGTRQRPRVLSRHHLHPERVQVGRLERQAVDQKPLDAMLDDLAGTVVPRQVSLLVLPKRRGQVDRVHRYPVYVHRLAPQAVQPELRHEHGVEAHAYLRPGRVVHHATLDDGPIDVVQEREHGTGDPERLLVRGELRQLDLTVGCLHGDGIVVYGVIWESANMTMAWVLRNEKDFTPLLSPRRKKEKGRGSSPGALLRK